jgi:ABC-type Fe3+/spermidine/putrescine transport system ATPase subunit
VVQEGTPAQIYHHPTSRFVAGFIGESNFFQGQVVHLEDTLAAIQVPGFARPVRAPLSQPVTRGQSVTIMVRPERMVVKTALDDSLDNVGLATVRKIAFLGMYTQVVAELVDGTTIAVHQTSEENSAAASQDMIGQQVHIGWKMPDGQALVD